MEEMMENKTPSWLIETQNKSWEPEILISGISLTILFLLQNQIFNFNAMLVQDIGFPYPIALAQNTLSLIILNAVKIALIIHLLLRGLWTGLVGLSYVFPKGVKIENLPKSVNFKEFKNPEKLVMSIEKICSLLFSFIFTFILHLALILTLYSPLILICYFVSDLYLIEYILWIFVGVIFLFSLLIRTKWKYSRVRNLLENSILSSISYTFSTNIGKGKSILIFFGYFIFILLLSFSSIKEFKFSNKKQLSQEIVENNILRNESYKSERNNNLRIKKAVISDFVIKQNYIKLFISRFKADQFILSSSNERKMDFNKISGKNIKGEITDIDLYNISIDENQIGGINWYKASDSDTQQDGFLTIINTDSLKKGIHKINIDKVVFNIDEDSLKLVKNWEFIPFEKR